MNENTYVYNHIGVVNTLRNMSAVIAECLQKESEERENKSRSEFFIQMGNGVGNVSVILRIARDHDAQKQTIYLYYPERESARLEDMLEETGIMPLFSEIGQKAERALRLHSTYKSSILSEVVHDNDFEDYKRSPNLLIHRESSGVRALPFFNSVAWAKGLLVSMGPILGGGIFVVLVLLLFTNPVGAIIAGSIAAGLAATCGIAALAFLIKHKIELKRERESRQSERVHRRAEAVEVNDDDDVESDDDSEHEAQLELQNDSIQEWKKKRSSSSDEESGEGEGIPLETFFNPRTKGTSSSESSIAKAGDQKGPKKGT